MPRNHSSSLYVSKSGYNFLAQAGQIPWLNSASECVRIKDSISLVSVTLSDCKRCEQIGEKLFDLEIEIDDFIHKLKRKNLFGDADADPKYRNLLAKRFEEQVGKYYEDNYGYTHLEIGYKPNFLKGKEIDVYEELKRGNIKCITVCECKLRFNDYPISITEIKKFKEKVSLCSKYEQKKSREENYSLRFFPTFISNIDRISDDALRLTKIEKIKFLIAKIPHNWPNRSDWRIENLERCK